ncbi:S-layer homology domain-containing protein [Virgibacillus halodenitrificans]|uniref:S-layer homology domain-containing protein n=1 Tax=Virgibacillus halodenitrificans TaxID=1482 RepID=UPI000EF521DF|nr:S-layer homology domain-containing protein [Virgibacillus halodenitrificans]
MRKLGIIVILSIICFFSVPLEFSAEGNQESDKGQASEEFNELGIKKGTEVYGEDISELPEDELQYIPEGWRDGKFESEHPEADDTENRIRLQGIYPDVNSYISSKNLPQAKVEYNHLSHLPVMNYRYFRPEGVVAHETANDNSTITGEISYMSRNYKNAFVHAFVDDSRVIEIHPTRYSAWGAGRFANARYIHVELVRVHSFDEFARSINNYANYIATLLFKYDLGYDNAEWDGNGTLWSHKAVSRHLGGTTHVDPHGYFARYGYDWVKFSELVYAKLGNMGMKKESTSKLGKIKSENDPIYADPEDQSKYKKAGKTHSNTVYYIKQQATLRGETYYLISDQPSSKNGTIGWVNSKDIKVYTHSSVDRDMKLMYLTGSGVAYDRAWGGSENIVYNKLAPMTGDILEVNLTESVGNNTWYRGYLQGKQVWVHEDHLASFSDIVFTDVPTNSSHFSTIYEMVKKGAIQGYEMNDGTHAFKPGEKLTRSHAAVIFTEALNLQIPQNVEEVLENFEDIDGSHLYAKQIAATYQAGIFKGSNGKFMDGPLTREQMATIISHAFELKDTGVPTGIKLSGVSVSHKRNVELLAQHGITVKLDNFMPYEPVTRGQFATFVSKAMHVTK